MKQTLLLLLCGAVTANANSFFAGGGLGDIDDKDYFFIQAGFETPLEGDKKFTINYFFEYANTDDSLSQSFDPASLADGYYGTEEIDYNLDLFTLNASFSYAYADVFWVELGVGLGLAKVSHDFSFGSNLIGAPDAYSIGDESYNFAGQIFLNIGANLGDHVKLYAGVKFIATGGDDVLYSSELATQDSTLIDTFSVSESISEVVYQAGVRFTF